MKPAEYLAELVELVSKAGGTVSFSVDFREAALPTPSPDNETLREGMEEVTAELNRLSNGLRQMFGIPPAIVYVEEMLGWLHQRLDERQMELNELETLERVVRQQLPALASASREDLINWFRNREESTP